MKNHATVTTFLLTLICVAFFHFLNGQDTIYFKNPSFEDVPHKGVQGMPTVKMWKDCGWSQFPLQSPPDVQPVIDNAWGVTMRPNDGDTYLGMVVRANHTWESVGQQLKIPLREGACYSLNVMLALSNIYQSGTVATLGQKNGQLESFVNPVMLVIWGGQFDCDKLEILAESSEVDNFEWKPYSFILSPQNDYSYITLEAYYSKSSLQHYNGHIMVDNLSPIIKIDCK